MISLERCSEVMKKNGCHIDNEMMQKIREYLYQLASLQIEEENKRKKEVEDESDIVL